MARLRSKQSRRGIALIETAIVLPLLLTIVFGVIEYGWIFTKSGQVINIARHGVRIGVRPDATDAHVADACVAMLTAGGMQNTAYTVQILDSAGVATTVGALEPGQSLTVTVTVPYASLALVGFPLVPVPEELSAAVTMVKEGP